MTVDRGDGEQPTATPDADTPEAGRGDRQHVLVDIDPASVLTLLGAALATALVYAVITLAPDMLTKIFVGIVLALALDPVVVRIYQRFSWRRGTAVALVGTVLGLGVAAVLVVLGPAAIDQASSLRSDLPSVIQEAYSWPVVGERLAEADIAAEVDDTIDQLPARLDDRQLTRFAEGLLGGLFTTLVVLLTAVAVMLEGEGLVRRTRNLVVGDRRERLDRIGRVVYRTFGNYFAGSLFVAFLNGFVILSVGLALGVPLTPLAALWSTLTNLIPQVGGFLGGSFFVLLALTEGPLTAAIALGVFLVYQNIENNVVQPAVVGRAVDLSPPTTMLAALIGGAVAGVPGALVATPILGAAKVLYTRQYEEREDIPGTHRGQKDDGHHGVLGRIGSLLRRRRDQ